MHPRLRKLIAAVGVVAFMIFYIWAAVTVADRLPDNRAIKMLYFVVAGAAWGLPLFPLIAWAQRRR